MIRGIYIAAAGMVTNMTRMMRITNNIANISTPGYKQDISPTEVVDDMILAIIDGTDGSVTSTEIGTLTTVIVADRPELDLRQGLLAETGLPFDLALTGDGFFTVQKDGETFYTRNGSFVRDADGRLRTEDGGIVQGIDGALTIPDGLIMVNSIGDVSVGGQAVGRLAIAELTPDATLRKVGQNYFVLDTGTVAPAGNTDVLQGFLEGSNVEAANVMVEMLSTQRAYQVSQRMLVMQDSLLQKTVNELGRL